MQFKTIEQVSLRYIGQVRLLPVYSDRKQQGNPPDYDDMNGGGDNVDYELKQCGYGKLIWPDESTFEGYWINGQACGIGVFCGPPDKRQVFEGYWQQDKATGLCVFRQSNVIEYYGREDGADPEASQMSTMDKQHGEGIEVWSDGSYYLGNFEDGMKQGWGIYFWADGSKYTGNWSRDEMSGNGVFEWADGRYFEGQFKNGVMHGNGKYVWQDERMYEG